MSPTPGSLPNRIIGDFNGLKPGPTMVVFGAIHGNEPAGVMAAQRVLGRLSEGDVALSGRLVAMVGNRQALASKERYLCRDLNRCWSDRHIGQLLSQPPSEDSPEDIEQRALIDVLHELHTHATEPVIFIDLHSTSGHGAPFCAMADTLRNRRIAFALPIPIILGLEEAIDTAMLGWLSDLGHIGLVVEGGQHDDPATPAFLESALWMCLSAAGMLPQGNAVDVPGHMSRLTAASGGLPAVVEILYRHAIEEADQYKMAAGFKNFQPVDRGEILGYDAQGAITAPMGGRMLMPLYQAQGSDGFFIAQDVAQRWLRLSAWLRHRRADRLLPLLPGVRRDPHNADNLIINPAIARIHPVDVFHLFGYRRRHDRDGQLIFSRRRPDHHPILPPDAARPPPLVP